MSYYKSKHFFENDNIENFSLNLKPTVKTYEKYVSPPVPVKQKKEEVPVIPTKLDKSKISINPNFWGSGLWCVLHLGAANYPKNPSITAKKRMKWFILGLPYILPCENCFQHAVDYIEKSKNNLDKICDSRDNLFEFFHNFHNDVNKRLGKSICTMDKAKDLFC